MSMERHWDPRRKYLRLWVELCNRRSSVLIGLVQWAFLKVTETWFKVLIIVMVLVFLILLYLKLFGWLACGALLNYENKGTFDDSCLKTCARNKGHASQA